MAGLCRRVNRRKVLSGLIAAASTTALSGCGLLGPLQPPASPAGQASPTPGRATPSINPTPTPTAAVPSGQADSYLAVAPKTLRVGQSEQVSVSLLRNKQPISSPVNVTLLKNGKTVAQATAQVPGRGQIALAVPRQAAEGEYQLEVSADSFRSQATVQVEDGTLLFLESDKPIYKPGQTIHLRVLTLDPQLRPVASPATIELADAKGLKVFKQDLSTDDYGMASLDVPLSTEPNLGVWKATAKAGKRTAQLDVRVERYVLPKYEVSVSLPKDWVLASDEITGSVSAEYSYGKAVQGEVEIRATRYVGTWQEFASVAKALDGKADFRLPAAQYVSGVPGAGGMGNVSLEVTVREKATGYEEKTTKLLNVAASPVTLQVVPESLSFRPGLPLNLLVLAQTPDHQPTDASVKLDLGYTKPDFSRTQETKQVSVKGGKALLTVTPPAEAVGLSLYASAGQSSTSLTLQAGYSPSGAFVHVEQADAVPLKVGDRARFRVSATKEAGSFYYEVVARNSVVYSDYTKSPEIEVPLTPQMAPRARLLVYQIQPNSEVAADYVPFDVEGSYPQKLAVAFAKEEAKPGETLDLSVQAEGEARVGIAAVDRSVFILAENRLNLQQVFAELERLYQQPQVELHSLGQPDVAAPGGAVPMPKPVPDAPVGVLPAPVAPRPGIAPMVKVGGPVDSGKLQTRGAKEVFGDAGVVVLSNQQVPGGKEYAAPQREMRALAAGAVDNAAPAGAPVPAAAPMAAAKAADQAGDGLAEVQRVRQFFPETWLWETLTTDGSGKARKQVEAPDSITTWMLRAVALSKTAGLGIGESQLRVLQPFFVQVDLPYSAIRGEELPVQVALYNYQDRAEEFVVEIEQAEWFDLLDQPSQRVQVGPSDLGAASFKIRTSKLGTQKVKVTARSTQTADAVVKELIIEPEGVAREVVDNLVLAAPTQRQVDLTFPQGVIEGSPRASVALTGSYLTQTIEGLEKLLQMPFGCGEQNMILFAPNVFVTRYLKATGQTKPEVMAKAEQLMITGYQRELTYRRGDGSFSAFGDSDKDGSLWLTAFVLKTFAQAKDLIFVDDAVLTSARNWIAKQQKADGSFNPVGFVHHQELLGGLTGQTALSAYVALALREAGETASSAKAITYIEGALDGANDAYTLALGAYALALAKSPKAGSACDRLLKLAHESEDGLSWGDDAKPVAQRQETGIPPRPNQGAAIETTGYSLLAFLERGDRLTASRAARWLVSQRNAYGGFGSTQDTVVGLQALASYASSARADVDATVALQAGNWRKDLRVAPENADVLQIVEVPLDAASGGANGKVALEVAGKGQVVVQVVRRYNLPDVAERSLSVFQVKVDYGAAQVAVDDLIDVTASVRYTPPEPIPAGMVVVDVAVPTGFAPESDTLDALVGGKGGKPAGKIKRYDVAGRKVSLYVEDMQPNEEVVLAFKARALYPVKAQAVTSQAYSYYRPEWKGESLGGALVVAS